MKDLKNFEKELLILRKRSLKRMTEVTIALMILGVFLIPTWEQIQNETTLKTIFIILIFLYNMGLISCIYLITLSWLKIKKYKKIINK